MWPPACPSVRPAVLLPSLIIHSYCQSRVESRRQVRGRALCTTVCICRDVVSRDTLRLAEGPRFCRSSQSAAQMCARAEKDWQGLATGALSTQQGPRAQDVNSSHTPLARAPLHSHARTACDGRVHHGEHPAEAVHAQRSALLLPPIPSSPLQPARAARGYRCTRDALCCCEQLGQLLLGLCAFELRAELVGFDERVAAFGQLPLG